MMKIAVNMLRECLFYSFILNFIKISLKAGTYFIEFKCKVCACIFMSNVFFCSIPAV